MAIPENYISKLRATGLLVSAPRGEQHVMPGFVLVAKPAAVAGNALPERARTWGPFGDVLVDTPLLTFYQKGGRWFVVSHDYIPGPGPGDFVNEWPTADDAVADLLAFFFGDPARMNAKSREARIAATRARIAAARPTDPSED